MRSWNTDRQLAHADAITDNKRRPRRSRPRSAQFDVDDFPAGQFERRRITTWCVVNSPVAGSRERRRRLRQFNSSHACTRCRLASGHPADKTPTSAVLPCSLYLSIHSNILAASFSPCSWTLWYLVGATDVILKTGST